MASDDVDYSSLISNQLEQAPLQAQEAKSSKSGLKARKTIAERASEKPDGVDIPEIVNTAKTINNQIGAPEIPGQVSNTMNWVTGGTGVLAGLLAIYAATQHKKAKEALEALAAAQDEKPDLRKDLFKTAAQDPLEVTPEKTPLQQLKERVLAGREAGIGNALPEESVAPGPIQRQALPQTVGAPPFATSAPKAPVPPVQAPTQVAPATPSVAEAIATGQPGSKVADAVVREQLATKSGFPAIAGTGEQRLRSPRGGVYESPAKVSAGQVFVPGYGTGDVHLVNTYGPEGARAVLDRFNGGKPIGDYKNLEALRPKIRQGVPASEVPDLMSKLPAAEEAGNYGGPKGAKPATVGGQKGMVMPEEQLQKGSISPGQLLNLLGNALGIYGNYKAYQHGKKTGDWSDFGIGTIGQVLGNVAPRTVGLGYSLMAPTSVDPEEMAKLEERRKMKPTIDRAIAPR